MAYGTRFGRSDFVQPAISYTLFSPAIRSSLLLYAISYKLHHPNAVARPLFRGAPCMADMFVIGCC